MINNHEKIGSKPIKAIMKIHEGQMDEMQNQFKSRILSLQTVLKETQLNLDFEINKNCELKLQLEKEKTKFESEVLKSQSWINEYKFKVFNNWHNSQLFFVFLNNIPTEFYKFYLVD